MIPIKDQKIVLVGGAGFIGHNLALELKRLGADVQVIDSLHINNIGAFVEIGDAIQNNVLYLKLLHSRLHLLNEAGIPLHVIDARDYQVLGRTLGILKPDVIVHLAAVAHANQSNKNPYNTFDHSLRTLENGLDCSRGYKPHFIYFSSSMIYGNFAAGTVTEETPCNPIGIYGALKFAGEKLVQAYNQVFDMPYTIIRPSALYGERCVSRRVGQIFIENALNGLDIEVTGDGTDRLDFTYVMDLIQGLVKVIGNKNSFNQIFNITYGSGRSIEEMLDILRAHIPDVKVNMTPRDRLMPKRGTLSIDKARDLIGYNPDYPLEKGFVHYIKWYKNLFNNND